MSGNYCSRCGQHSRVARLNASSFIREVSETVFQIERGFFKTVIDLFWRPGYAMREYLEGKRREYYKPLAYALMLSTAYFLFTNLFGLETFFGQAVTGFNAGYKEGVKGDFKLDLNVILDNYAIITLMLIPLYALAMYIAFFNKRYNILEHIAIRSFVVGQQAIIYLFFSLLFLLLGQSDLLESIAALMPIVYVFWVNTQLFGPNKKWKSILKTAGFYILLFIFLQVLLGITTVLLLIFNQISLD